MKATMKSILVFCLILVPIILISQPHPYDPGIGGGTGGNPVGGGAPLAGGLIILLSLGMGYAARKVYEIRKKLTD